MSQTIPEVAEYEVARKRERRFMRLRHLGRAETIILRDEDVMRLGLRVGLQNIRAGGLVVISTSPLRMGEQLKVRLRNDVQRFYTELRGAVRWIQPGEDGRFLIEIELFTRLMPLDVMMLRRVGVADHNPSGKVWV